MEINDVAGLEACLAELDAGQPRVTLLLRGEIAKNMGRAMNVMLDARARSRTEDHAATLTLGLGVVAVAALPFAPVAVPVAMGVAALCTLGGSLGALEWAKRRMRSAMRKATDTPFGPEAARFVAHGYVIGRNRAEDGLELRPA